MADKSDYLRVFILFPSLNFATRGLRGSPIDNERHQRPLIVKLANTGSTNLNGLFNWNHICSEERWADYTDVTGSTLWFPLSHWEQDSYFFSLP